MARRVMGGRQGEYFPQITDGIRARAAYLESGFSGIGHTHRDRLDTGQPVTMGACEVWSALYAVDPDAAQTFGKLHGGPWNYSADVPGFEYDPRTAMLSPASTQAEIH